MVKWSDDSVSGKLRIFYKTLSLPSGTITTAVPYNLYQS